jgi:lipoprotein-anchoring transpeptidase ErfK/SrfK
MFRIYEKHITHTMAGREAADPFDLRDVPFVQYFTGGYALHAAYWHDDFGKEHSHGCVNLAPKDAAWLFAWTDPRIPESWHGVMTGSGTIVFVHD